ncbi:MAG: hypothetical protein K2P81_09790 [Bacteriovoracaceae bacterium]|nr:hypothetical protein [Bacteriovoracaceae bacterium]
MKWIFIVSLLMSSAFAAPGDLLLTCTRTSFRDLDQIVINESVKPGMIMVTEIDEAGRKNIYERSMNDLKKDGIELSSWYGYTRTLSNFEGSWMIEHHDECGGGVGYAVCE